MGNNDILLAFDAYGTLLSTESIAEKLATYFGEEKAKKIAAAWRRYQLEYTWRINSMGVYLDFSTVTRRSLRHALLESGVSLDDGQTKDVMKAYNSLSTFPDVQPCLEKIKDVKDIRVVIFSNGTHEMVSSSVNNSPDLSPLASIFEDIIVVDDIRKYKPAHEAYQHLADKVKKDTLDAKAMGQIWLVSGNPFDVVGAGALGMKTIWVDRPGTGWQDCLIPTGRSQPSEVVRGLDEVPAIIKSIVAG